MGERLDWQPRLFVRSTRLRKSVGLFGTWAKMAGQNRTSVHVQMAGQAEGKLAWAAKIAMDDPKAWKHVVNPSARVARRAHPLEPLNLSVFNGSHLAL